MGGNGSQNSDDTNGGTGAYSDELANGDIDDDKELEKEEDPNDDVVDDNLYIQTKSSHIRPPSSNLLQINEAHKSKGEEEEGHWYK